jgi:hypothetical protein
VVVLSNREFEQRVRDQGFGFHAVLDDAAFDRMSEDPDFLDEDRGAGVFANHLVVPAMRPTYRFLAQEHIPGETLVVAQTRMLGAAAAYEKLAIPFLTASLSPYEFTHFLGTAPDRAGDILQEPLRRFRGELGMSGTVDDVFAWTHSPAMALGLFPAWFREPGPDWPVLTQLTGFIPPELGPAPPEIGDFMAQGPPPLIFIPGTFNFEIEFFFRESLKICRRLKRRGLLISRFAEDPPQRLSEDVLHCRFAPLAAILPRAAALIHHGGIGTCAEALRAGVPQLVIPRAYDQRIQAQCVAALGAGEQLPAGDYRVARVAPLLERLLTSDETAGKCRGFASRLADSRAVEDTCGLIERWGACLNAARGTTVPYRVGFEPLPGRTLHGQGAK